MKIEIGTAFPQYFKSAYPEEFDLFSHLETTSAIPSVLFAITTWKANGEPNVCFHAWSCFHGDKTAFFCGDGRFVSKNAYLCEYYAGQMLLYQLSANPLL